MDVGVLSIGCILLLWTANSGSVSFGWKRYTDGSFYNIGFGSFVCHRKFKSVCAFAYIDLMQGLGRRMTASSRFMWAESGVVIYNLPRLGCSLASI